MTGRVAFLARQGAGAGVEFLREKEFSPESFGPLICAFMNRCGGEIVIGLDENGRPAGLSDDDIKKWFDAFNYLLASEAFDPPLYLRPVTETLFSSKVIYLAVPRGNEVQRFKGSLYIRRDRQNVLISDDGETAALNERRHNLFSESRIYPYVGFFDLRIDLLPKLRAQAMQGRGRGLKWQNLNDHELLADAGLYVTDRFTGKKGFKLAAVLLLGKDELIGEILPHYETRVVFDLPDFKEETVIKTNLVTAYEQIMAKITAGLETVLKPWDLRQRENLLAMLRELLINSLIHRDFSAPAAALIKISPTEILCQNPSVPWMCGLMAPDSVLLCVKNPVIENFFRILGYSDAQCGGIKAFYQTCAGLFKQSPVITEGDMFTVRLPFAALPRTIENPAHDLKPAAAVKPAQPAPVSDRLNAPAFEVVSASPAADKKPESAQPNDPKLNFIKNVGLIKKRFAEGAGVPQAAAAAGSAPARADAPLDKADLGVKDYLANLLATPAANPLHHAREEVTPQAQDTVMNLGLGTLADAFDQALEKPEVSDTDPGTDSGVSAPADAVPEVKEAAASAGTDVSGTPAPVTHEPAMISSATAVSGERQSVERMLAGTSAPVAPVAPMSAVSEPATVAASNESSSEPAPPKPKVRGTIRENDSGWLPFADPSIELLNIIKLYPAMTNVELAEKLGWSTGRIKFYVKKLKDAGVISRLGTDRKGMWKTF